MKIPFKFYFSVNFFHLGTAIRQQTVPRIAMINRIVTVICQLKLSESLAMPYVAIAEPIYVQELIAPEIVEMLPYFLNRFGT